MSTPSWAPATRQQSTTAHSTRTTIPAANGAVGWPLTNLNFSLALFKPVAVADRSSYYALQACALNDQRHRLWWACWVCAGVSANNCRSINGASAPTTGRAPTPTAAGHRLQAAARPSAAPASRRHRRRRLDPRLDLRTQDHRRLRRRDPRAGLRHRRHRRRHALQLHLRFPAVVPAQRLLGHQDR